VFPKVREGLPVENLGEERGFSLTGCGAGKGRMEMGAEQKLSLGL